MNYNGTHPKPKKVNKSTNSSKLYEKNFETSVGSSLTKCFGAKLLHKFAYICIQFSVLLGSDTCCAIKL